MEINDLYIYVHSLETVLFKIVPLLHQNDNPGFAKVVDLINTELLVNSIVQSFEKLEELLTILSQPDFEWRRPVTITTIKHCIDLDLKLFKILSTRSTFKKISIVNIISDNIKKTR